MKKVYYFLRTDISTLPPVITQLYALNKLGYKVCLVVGELCKESKAILNGFNIEYYCAKENSNKLKKLISYIKLIKQVKKNIDYKNDLIWIGSFDTGLYCSHFILKRKCKYYVNIFELYDQFPKLQKKLKHICRNAEQVIVPEINRAYFLKFKYGLNKLPYVIPNKPLLFDSEISNETKKIIDNLKSLKKRIILFQGWFGKKYGRDLTPILYALKELQKEYVLLLMGPKNDEEYNFYKSIYDDVLYCGFIVPPEHLSIMKEAYIGIACYDENSLNNIYCAPNKIYEYGSIGLPMLCNDIPGLRFTVGFHNAGECIDINSREAIKNAILKISDNYDYYSSNSKKLYEEIDILQLIKDLMNGWGM